jgi:hypothetical protein
VIEIVDAVAVGVVERVVGARGFTSLSYVEICKKDEGGGVGGSGWSECDEEDNLDKEEEKHGFRLG